MMASKCLKFLASLAKKRLALGGLILASLSSPSTSAATRLYSSDEADRITWTAINFPQSNHFRLRRSPLNLSKQISSWASHWIARVDPHRIIFLNSDHATVAAELESCVDQNQISKAIYSICLLGMENLLNVRLENFFKIARSISQTPTLFIDVDESLDRENSIDPEAWPINSIEQSLFIRKMLSLRVIEDRLAGKGSSEAYLNIERWITQFTSKMSNRESVQKVEDLVNAFYQTFDLHSEFMGPETYNNFVQQLDGYNLGIGVVLQKNEIGEYIVSPKVGSAAARAGLIEGDVLLGLYGHDESDFTSADEINTKEVLETLQKDKDSSAKFRIRRSVSFEDGTKGIREFDVVVYNSPVSQDDQKVHAKVYSKNRKNILVFSAGDFYREISKDIKNLYLQIKQRHGKLDGVVLDLSNNPGGHLHEAIKVAGLFVKKSVIAQSKAIEQNIFGSNFQTLKLDDPSEEVLFDGPLIVKINERSASASEIVAAFLQDSGRALIVGHRSYGKGTIQRIFPAFHQSIQTMMARFRDQIDFEFPNTSDRFEMGGVKITVGNFYRINGGTTQCFGVSPDFYLYPNDENQRVRYESSYPNSMPPDFIQPIENFSYKPHKFVSQANKRRTVIVRSIQRNSDLMELGNLLAIDLARQMAPVKLNLRKRIEEQRIQVHRIQNAMLNLRKNNDNSSFNRTDYFLLNDRLNSQKLVVDFESSVEGFFGRSLGDSDAREKLRFNFEKNRAEMNEILKIFGF